MRGETPRQRARRRFAFGALEQLANIFGGITASVLTVGLFLPAINALTGTGQLDAGTLRSIALLVLGFTTLTATAAFVLRGLARLLEDEGVRQPAAMD
jgi:hypothetical protein